MYEIEEWEAIVVVGETLQRVLPKLEAVGWGVEMPKVEWVWKGRYTGMAERGKIVINLHTARQSKRELVNTVVHELAHVVVMRYWPRAQSHGVEWQGIMQLLGEEPRRCHNLHTVPARGVWYYVGECECRKHYISGKRKARYDSFTCNSCRGKIEFTGDKVRREEIGK